MGEGRKDQLEIGSPHGVPPFTTGRLAAPPDDGMPTPALRRSTYVIRKMEDVVRVAFLEATARKADFRMCKHDAVASALALFAISLTVGSLEARFHRGSQDAALADVELYLLGAVWVVNSLTCCCLLSRWRRMVGRVGREPQYVEEQASSCSWMIVELCANCISPLPGRNPNDTDGFDVHEAIALLVFARVYLFLRLACSVDELYRRRRLIRAELQARSLRLVPSVHSRAYKPATRACQSASPAPRFRHARFDMLRIQAQSCHKQHAHTACEPGAAVRFLHDSIRSCASSTRSIVTAFDTALRLSWPCCSLAAISCARPLASAARKVWHS